MTLFVDYREERGNLLPILRRMDIPIEVKNLEIGDYVTIGETGSLCIERKTTGDYVHSIVNEQLNNELYQMSTNYRWSLLIIDGSPTDALIRRKFKRERYFNYLGGCIIENSMDGECGTVSVVTMETEYDTANLIKTLYRKVVESDIFREPSAMKVKMPLSLQRIYAIQRFPFIGPVRGKALKKHFGTIKAIVNATTEELLEVEDIGKVIANELFIFFNEE